MDTVGNSKKITPVWYTKIDPNLSREDNMRLMGCSNPQPIRLNHVCAAPLVQFFSVFVSTNFDDECQIYGHIRATELADGTSFDLYSRYASECETIFKDGCLSLSGPEGDAIHGYTRVTIEVCLKDRTRDIDLINARILLDCTREKSRDKLMNAVIVGEHGTVCLYYTIFRFSAYGIVEVSICQNSTQPDRFDKVHGSLVASYNNSGQYCNTDDEVKYLKTTLFEKPRDMAVVVMDKVPIKLLRSVVVAPAYSSLTIKVDLSSSHGHLAAGLVEFPVGASYSKTISFENGYVEIIVRWKVAYPRMYKESTNLSPPQRLSYNFATLSDPSLVSSSNPNGKSNIKGFEGVEIFTVYVGGVNHEVSTLYGSIKLDYGYSGYFDIYNRSQSEAEPLLDDNTVCIELHEAIRNTDFNIELDLKNPNQDLQISYCELGWNPGMIEYGAYGLLWYDKRICSVAKGANGYAAVHYMILGNATQATLEVSLICEDNVIADVPPDIYGRICARYGGHNYSTEYEKLYYKSILFNKQQHNPEKPSGCDLKVRLIKSVMLVPLNSHLIIEAGLKIICSDNSDEESVFGEQEFWIDASETTHKEIGRDLFELKCQLHFLPSNVLLMGFVVSLVNGRQFSNSGSWIHKSKLSKKTTSYLPHQQSRLLLQNNNIMNHFA